MPDNFVPNIINNIPLSALNVYPYKISAQESKFIYDIWNGPRDMSGHPILPDDIDENVLSSLVSKKVIEIRYGMAENGSQSVRCAKLNPEGKDLVKKMILSDDHCAFEQKRGQKVACKTQEAKKNNSWFHKIFHGN